MLLNRNKSSLCLGCLAHCCLCICIYFITAGNCVCSKRRQARCYFGVQFPFTFVLCCWVVVVFSPQMFIQVEPLIFVKIALIPKVWQPVFRSAKLLQRNTLFNFFFFFWVRLLRCLWDSTRSNQSVHPFNQPSIQCPSNSSSIYPSTRLIHNHTATIVFIQSSVHRFVQPWHRSKCVNLASPTKSSSQGRRDV